MRSASPDRRGLAPGPAWAPGGEAGPSTSTPPPSRPRSSIGPHTHAGHSGRPYSYPASGTAPGPGGTWSLAHPHLHPPPRSSGAGWGGAGGGPGGGGPGGPGGGSPPAPAPPALPSLELSSLRFHDPALEGAFLARQADFCWGALDRPALGAVLVMLLLSWLLRGSLPACQPLLALSSLAYAAHAAAVGALQAAADAEAVHAWRTPCLGAVRLAYAASFAAANTGCRAAEYAGCSSPPALHRFLGDSGLLVLVFQTFALPLPFRSHLRFAAASLAALLLLNNQPMFVASLHSPPLLPPPPDACTALANSCHAAWFDSPLPQHHRLAKALLAAAGPLLGRGRGRQGAGAGAGAAGAGSPPPAFGPLQACWCSLLVAQVVAGFLLPGCVLYGVEEAARRRFLAGWRRRLQLRAQR